MPDPFEKDPELVRACMRGDARAWETLLSRYERLIYAIPRTAGLDSDEASDVYQEVCVALYRGLPRLKSAKALTAWIITTTRRITRDHRVKARRTTPLLDPTTGEPVHEPVDHAPLVSEVLKELELQHGMRLQLTRLGERCRRLLLLLFYTDPAPSYPEISRELGIPVGSIGPTRARCFEKLKELL